MNTFHHLTIEATGFCNAQCKWCKTGIANRKSSPVPSYLKVSDLEKGLYHLEEHAIIGQNCLVDLFNWGNPS